MHPRLAAAARRQGGVFTGRQAREAGYDRHEVERLRTAGEWVALRRAVYAPRALVEDARDPVALHRLPVAAALLALGPGAVASHESAAVLLGLPLLGAPPGDVRVTSDVARRCRRYPGLQVAAAPLPTAQVTRVDGLPCATVARTVVDLARELPFGAGVVVADAALGRSGVDHASLREVLDGCERWPGSRAARRVLRFADGLAEAPSESLARVMCADEGLPPPELQKVVWDAAGAIGRVDLFWGRWRTVGEVDGRVKYAGEDAEGALWREKKREDRLREAGFEVVRMTWAQVVHEPAETAARVRAAFRRARARRAA